MTTIDRTLNLVVPIERETGATVYVHAAPIAYAIFEIYYLVLSKTFASLMNQGLSIGGGPRAAWFLLRDIAKSTPRPSGLSWWEGEDGVEKGLMMEIQRLANVVMPVGSGWDTKPLQDALDSDYLSAEDVGEVLNQIVFFTLASRVPERKDRITLILGGARMSNSQTTSLDATEYARSLKTSTKDAPSGAKPDPTAPQSSVPG